MENIFEQLEKQCKEAGTNLTKVCRAAGVSRTVPVRWKVKEPKTIRIYRALLAAIPQPVNRVETKGDEVVC